MSYKKKDIVSDVISLTAFASMMKCTKGAVSNAIKDGKIVDAVVRGDNGRVSGVDWRKAKREWLSNYDLGNNPTSGVLESFEAEGMMDGMISGDIRDISESKKLQEHYKAELARIELEEKEKILVSASKVRKDLFSFATEVRVAMQGVPERVVDKVMVLSDRRDVKAEIRKGIDESLNKLTEVVERDFG